MYDVIVLGGGPAGLTAAVYSIRRRMETLLITEDIGGKTSMRLELPFVEGYEVIGGADIVERFSNQLRHLPYTVSLEKAESLARVEDGFVVTTRAGQEHRARAVILATGVHTKFLNVPGESRFLMRGVCYSAVSYAPLFLEREAAVIGDGELAMRSVVELAGYARRVVLITGDGHDRASPLAAQLRSMDNVAILERCEVKEICGDEWARNLVVEHEGSELAVTVDGIFVERELIPNSQLVQGIVELDERGKVIVDHRNRTSLPGLFAAGDVTDAFGEQVLIAIGEGAKAALSAHDYLLQKGIQWRMTATPADD